MNNISYRKSIISMVKLVPYRSTYRSRWGTNLDPCARKQNGGVILKEMYNPITDLFGILAYK